MQIVVEARLVKGQSVLLTVKGEFTAVRAVGGNKYGRAPEEGIYLEAAKRLGVEPNQCIMADDNLNVLKTAKRVGMGTIGVYDDSSKDVEGEMRCIADRYVVDFSELL